MGGGETPDFANAKKGHHYSKAFAIFSIWFQLGSGSISPKKIQNFGLSAFFVHPPHTHMGLSRKEGYESTGTLCHFVRLSTCIHQKDFLFFWGGGGNNIWRMKTFCFI